jgi:hypothetical protein
MANITITNGRIIHPRVTIQNTSTGINLPAERQLTAIDRIVNHHPVSGTMPEMAGINAWWRGNRNWDRAGYHLIIRNDGSIWQLVPLHAPAWGAGPAANGRGIQISIAGNFTATNLPSRKAQEAYGWLVNQLLNSAQIPNLNHITHVTRHSDWMATSCSGYTLAQARSWVEGNFSTTPTPPRPIPPTTNVTIGQNVRLQNGATWMDNNAPIPSFVINRENRIHSINGERIVLSHNGIILGAVRNSDIIQANAPVTTAPRQIEVGARVRVNINALTWATGQTMPNWVRGQIYTVEQLRNKNQEALLSDVRSWIRVHDLTLI